MDKAFNGAGKMSGTGYHRYLSHGGRKLITVYASGKKDIQQLGLAGQIGYQIAKLFGRIL